MKDKLTTNKSKECIEKLGWLEKKVWDPRIDIIFEGGKIVEISSAKVKTTEKGQIKMNKEMAIFYYRAVHC